MTQYSKWGNKGGVGRLILKDSVGFQSYSARGLLSSGTGCRGGTDSASAEAEPLCCSSFCSTNCSTAMLAWRANTAVFSKAPVAAVFVFEKTSCEIFDVFSKNSGAFSCAAFALEVNQLPRAAAAPVAPVISEPKASSGRPVTWFGSDRPAEVGDSPRIASG